MEADKPKREGFYCHKTFSSIDFFPISTSLADNVFLRPTFIKANLKTERRRRRRLNTGFMSDSTFRKTIEDLKTFFEINIGSTEEITSVWEASKAYTRGNIILQHKSLKRYRLKTSFYEGGEQKWGND